MSWSWRTEHSAVLSTAGLLTLVLVLGVAPHALGQLAREDIGIHCRMVADAARAQLQADYPGVQYLERAGRLTTICAAPFSVADSPEESAAAFVLDYSAVLGVSADELAPGLAFRDQYTLPMMYEPDTDSYKFTLVYYHQVSAGIPVFRAELRLLVRNEDGYPLVLAQSDVRELGVFAVPAGFDGYAAEGAAHAAAIAQVPGLINFSPSELVIWAGVDDMEVSPAVAVTFTADSGEGSDPYENWLFVADAATGEILYQESLIYHTDIVGNVSGLCTPEHRADACATEVWTPLPYLKVTRSGREAFTDINGNFVLANPGTTPVDVTSTLTGRWFRVVNNGTGGNASITLSATPPGPANFRHNQSNAEHQTAEVNGYLQANIVRDMILRAHPKYPNIYNQTYPMMVTVNNRYLTCNASYYGGTIHFFWSGDGCNNTGFGDIVHHEYGHHVVAMAPSGQGEYGEGMSDSIAMLITGRSQLALGFQTCTTAIRNADNNCKYLPSGCSTCGSAIHTCGQLLSGCIWDTWKELKITEPVNHLSIIRRLTVNSVLMHGTGTSITPAITIHFLTLDDNDGNLANGTPHYWEIATGFGKHDMPAPVNNPPTVTISSPPNGAVYAQGQPVQFTGTATDPEDGNITAKLVWTSNLQGQIGTGGSFTRSDLAVGAHIITARVTDSGGLQGTAAVTITIQSSPPAAPSNLRAQNVWARRIDLCWNDNSCNEDGFRIAMSTNGVNFNNVGQTGPNTVTFRVENLQPNTPYWFKVRAFRGTLYSGYTNTINVVTKR